MKSILTAVIAAIVLAACASTADSTASSESQASRCKEEPTVGSNIGRRCKN